MKEIQLTKGYVTVIDDSDYELLSTIKWYVIICGNSKTPYAVNVKYMGYKKPSKTILMHRVIMGVTDPTITVDHKNSNTLDNRRSNLRVCSKADNNKNKSAHRNSSSKYVGVSFCKRRRRWMAAVCVGDKRVFSRQFDTEIEAALAYNIIAKELRGEFAKLNPIPIGEYNRMVGAVLIPKRKAVRPVNKIEPITGIVLKSYSSIASAGRDNNISPSAIYDCCNGVAKTSAGFKWEFNDHNLITELNKEQ